MVLVEVVQETVALKMAEQVILPQQLQLKDIMVPMHYHLQEIEAVEAVAVLLLSVKQVNQVQEQVVLEEQEQPHQLMQHLLLEQEAAEVDQVNPQLQQLQ